MRFEIRRDEHGNPTHVSTDDGFAQCFRPFDPETDGWMLDQLSPHEFPAIGAGRQMAQLVDEVNYLRRENWDLRKQVEQWQAAAGYRTK